MVNVVERVDSVHIPDQLISAGLGVVVCANANNLPDAYIRQISDKSRQPHIMKHEGHEDIGTDEDPGRFRDIDAFRKWSSNKERILYMLIDEATHPGDLGVPDIGGVIWFGNRYQEHAPGRDVTFAIRNYAEDKDRGWGQYRGQGLGTPFMGATHADLGSRPEYQEKGLWLDLAEGNIPAERLYMKMGYEELCRVDDEDHPGKRRIVMANDTILKTEES